MTDDVPTIGYLHIRYGDSSLLSPQSHEYSYSHSQDRTYYTSKSLSWHPLLGSPIPCCEGVGLGYWPDDSLNFRGHIGRYTRGKKKTQEKVGLPKEVTIHLRIKLE